MEDLFLLLRILQLFLCIACILVDARQPDQCKVAQRTREEDRHREGAKEPDGYGR